MPEGSNLPFHSRKYFEIRPPVDIQANEHTPELGRQRVTSAESLIRPKQRGVIVGRLSPLWPGTEQRSSKHGQENKAAALGCDGDGSRALPGAGSR